MSHYPIPEHWTLEQAIMAEVARAASDQFARDHERILAALTKTAATPPTLEEQQRQAVERIVGGWGVPA